MSALEYFRSAMKKLHDSYREAVSDLTPEQLHFRPLDKGNPIAFMLWHVVRTEDTVVNFAWQKKPPVWNAEGWDKKFGMEPKAQGTGMTAEQAGGPPNLGPGGIPQIHGKRLQVHRGLSRFCSREGMGGSEGTHLLGKTRSLPADRRHRASTRLRPPG